MAKEHYELEKTIEEALSGIPKEYQEESFNHIAIVARALKSNTKRNPQEDLKQLQEYNQKLEKATKMIVEFNYKAFNKSIRNFSDIIIQLKNAHDNVKYLMKELTEVKEQMTSRSDDLSDLYSTHLEQKEFLEILKSIEQVQSSPKFIEKALEEKNYLKAVNIIEESLKLCSEQLNNIKALEPTQEYLKITKNTLHELLVDEIQKHVYEKDDKDDMIEMMISSLDNLNKLQEAQSRFIQLLRLKLRYLIDSYVSRFIEDKTFPLSEKTIIDMLKGLFKKIKRVLEKQTFIIHLIQEKMSDPSKRREISAEEWTSKTDPFANFESSLNIKLTKEVQEKLKDAISIKLNSGNKENELYMKALEEFLYKNMGDNDLLLQMKAKDIPNKIFMPLIKRMLTTDKMDENQNKQRLDAIEKDFSSLLLEALASEDTPKILTIAHTWNITQELLIQMFNDLLGITDTFIKKNALDRIKFRFVTNLTDEIKKSSVLSSYVKCTPYNMIYLYKPIDDFAQTDPKHCVKLQEFLEQVMKTSLLTMVQNDYKLKLEQLLNSDECFKPEDGIQPLLFSTIKMNEWIKELQSFSTSIPKNKDQFLEITEILLKKYYDECKLRFQDITQIKYCGQQSFQFSQFQQDPSIIDQQLYEMKFVKKDILITDTSSLLLLMNLHASLEWFSRKIELMTGWRYNRLGDKLGLDYFHQIFKEISMKCLYSLKIDLRARCFYYLDSIKNSNYFCQEDATEPEIFVTKFNQDLERFDQLLLKYLPNQREYLFQGTSLLVSQILIQILPKMKCKIFNKYGINLMKRNTFALQQNLSNFEKNINYDHVRRYYDLLNLSEKELIQNVVEKEPEFTLEQYKAILTTEGPNRLIKESSESLLVELWSNK